jgi:hypothetical protein
VPASERAPAAAPSGETPPAEVPHGTSATLGKLQLVLHGCRLEATAAGKATESQDVSLPAPCVFVTEGERAQVVDTERGPTLLVVSSRPLEGPPDPRRCDTKIRAVVVRGDRVAVSSEQQVIRMCGAEGPFDTILFHTLSASAS